MSDNFEQMGKKIKAELAAEKESKEVSVQEVKQELANKQSIGISGLEEFDITTMPVPFVRLVQPTSKKVLLKDNKTEAGVGTYFFSDVQETFAKLQFVILKAKHGKKTFTDKTTNEQKTNPLLVILGYLPDEEKMFLLSLSLMSFSGFGKFVAQLKKEKLVNVWDVQALATSHRVENDKGKFYVADFELGTKNEAVDIEKYQTLSLNYGDIVNKAFDEDVENVIMVDKLEESDLTDPPSKDIPF